MLKALKTLINNPVDQENLKTSPICSPVHSNIFSYSAKSSKQTDKIQMVSPVENPIDEDTVMNKEFDFESFHKNINQQKAKTAKVKDHQNKTIQYTAALVR